MTDAKCSLESEHKACCCNCKFHVRDYHHCTTLAKPPTAGCVCSWPKGWVCLAPEFDGVFSGWAEHGLCEMHEPVAPEVAAATKET